MKTHNNIKNYLKFEPKAQKLVLKVQKLDLKVQKLDLEAQKLDFSAFQLSGVGWICAQKKSLPKAKTSLANAKQVLLFFQMMKNVMH